MNWMLHLTLALVLLVVIVALFLYQKWLENHSDRYIHLHGDSRDAKFLEAQAVQAKRLETISRAKTIAIIVLILYVLAVAGLAAYTAWNSGGA